MCSYTERNIYIYIYIVYETPHKFFTLFHVISSVHDRFSDPTTSTYRWLRICIVYAIVEVAWWVWSYNFRIIRNSTVAINDDYSWSLNSCKVIVNALQSHELSTLWKSTITGETFILAGHTTCQTSNVIYLIECNKCNDQYIGETKNPIHRRINQHCSDINGGQKTSYCQALHKLWSQTT